MTSVLPLFTVMALLSEGTADVLLLSKMVIVELPVTVMEEVAVPKVERHVPMASVPPCRMVLL